MMTFFDFLLYWFVFGIIGFIIVARRYIKDEGYLTLGSLIKGFFLFLLSPIATLGCLYDLTAFVISVLNNSFTKIEDVVIWRSKSNRAKTVLFEDSNHED